jgi:hypothetical protein
MPITCNNKKVIYVKLFFKETLQHRWQGKGPIKMKTLFEKIIYFAFTIFIFIVLWKITAAFWDAFVPWNYKTDLIGIFVVLPALVTAAFILSSVSFKVIRDSGK